jgi:hypothetical protein
MQKFNQSLHERKFEAGSMCVLERLCQRLHELRAFFERLGRPNLVIELNQQTEPIRRSISNLDLYVLKPSNEVLISQIDIFCDVA